MSDPTTRDKAPLRQPVEGEAPRRRTSPLLWILVLVAILLAAWYFLGRGDAPPEATPAIGETAPQPSESPVSTEPARRERSTAEPAPPAVPADRAARPLARTAPEYPGAALRAGVEGTVVLRVQVGADGRPTDVQVAERSGSRDLDRAAERAVMGWTFEPAIRGGEAVASTVEIPVDFRAETQ
jgi:protein TonB